MVESRSLNGPLTPFRLRSGARLLHQQPARQAVRVPLPTRLVRTSMRPMRQVSGLPRPGTLRQPMGVHMPTCKTHFLSKYGVILIVPMFQGMNNPLCGVDRNNTDLLPNYFHYEMSKTCVELNRELREQNRGSGSMN